MCDKYWWIKLNWEKRRRTNHENHPRMKNIFFICIFIRISTRTNAYWWECHRAGYSRLKNSIEKWWKNRLLIACSSYNCRQCRTLWLSTVAFSFQFSVRWTNIWRAPMMFLSQAQHCATALVVVIVSVISRAYHIVSSLHNMDYISNWFGFSCSNVLH